MKESYALFSNWLIQHGNDPKAINYLFDIDRLVKRRKYAEDFFTLIRNKSFRLIYDLRHDHCYQKWFKNKEYFNQVTKWSFEYLSQSFDEYEEYEASHYFRSYANKRVLLIYSGNITCLKYKHPIQDVAVRIPIENKQHVLIHASYCSKCNCVFIHKAYYKKLRQRHRFLVASFVELSSDGYSPIPQDSMSVESELMRCGYSVKSNGMTTQERHQLLHLIISQGVLSKTQIIHYLKHFISFNGSQERMADAVSNWERDLEFVRKYNLDDHPTLTINKIEKYRHSPDIVFSHKTDVHNEANNLQFSHDIPNPNSRNDIFIADIANNYHRKYINKRIYHKGIDNSGIPLRYGYVTEETKSTITITFDSGFQAQYSKDIFLTGDAVCIF